MWEYLMAYGILCNYNPWVHHGEHVGQSDNTVDKYEEGALIIEVDSSSSDDMTPVVFDKTIDENFILQPMDPCSIASDSDALFNSQCSAQNIRKPSSENYDTESSEDASGVTLTYRQRRRLQSAEKTGTKRGPSRALKAAHQRLKNPETKPTATITKSMARIICSNAGQFIAECRNWVRHHCPLNSKNWARMDATAKQKLFDKIKAEWDLPTGSHVDGALKVQCSQLFRHWRYRLKERHFVGKLQDEALDDRPPEVDQATWRCHKDVTLDPEAEAKYEKFKKLHADQIKEHGVDNLMVEEAYSHVLRDFYTRGLGAGPCHPKKTRTEDELSELSLELQSQLTQQTNLLKQESANREASLNEKIESMQAEALQREQECRDEIERIKAEAMQRDREARERE